MACFKPLIAYRADDGRIVFVERSRGSENTRIVLPCGQCRGCRLERSRIWATRIMHEAAMFDRSAFVTLTYDAEHLPHDCGLNYRHFQLFMKRLRKAVGPTRFFMAGEYGDRFKRPHFHACLFGFWPTDCVPFGQSPAGFTTYRSPLLESLWPMGFSSFGSVTFDSAAYVARYCLKKVTGKDSHEHYERIDADSGEIFSISPEFARMSLRPGIGANWSDKFRGDFFPRAYCVVNGTQSNVPRYYVDRVCKSASVADVAAFESNKAERLSPNVAEDSTPERLAVRDAVLKGRLAFNKRKLE